MEELAWDIEQMYIEGYKPVTIAGLLDCHVDLVYDWIESNGLSAGAPEGADADYYGA
jgi:uncharacterized protein YjcR